MGVIVHVTATFRPRRQEDRRVELPAGARVGDLLRAVGAPASGTLAVRGQDVVPESTPLSDGETILLLSSFSGG